MIHVVVSGGFDPLHIGHVKHLQLAKSLGDYLTVLVSTDSDMVNKKGFCFMPLNERIAIIQELKCVDSVMETIDTDGTQAKTLRLIKPSIYAKGGDRIPDNMPVNEIIACEEIGCKIVYGVGEQLQSSTNLVRGVKMDKLTIAEHITKIRETTTSKGFDINFNDFEKLVLVHTEISEAVEELRHGHMPLDVYYTTDNQGHQKPEGYGVELADAVIRIMDICGYHQIDLENMINIKMKYNETRKWRHGGKKV
jgi:cytidyltransferase-like protein